MNQQTDLILATLEKNNEVLSLMCKRFDRLETRLAELENVVIDLEQKLGENNVNVN